MKNSSVVPAVVSSVLCISTIVQAASPVSNPFTVVVPSWNKELVLRHCDFTIPDSLDSDILIPFALCHAGVLAVQKSNDKKVIQQLLPDLNIFFCPQNPKKFLVLRRQQRQWQRTHLSDLNEFVGTKARIFVPSRN